MLVAFPEFFRVFRIISESFPNFSFSNFPEFFRTSRIFPRFQNKLFPNLFPNFSSFRTFPNFFALPEFFGFVFEFAAYFSNFSKMVRNFSHLARIFRNHEKKMRANGIEPRTAPIRTESLNHWATFTTTSPLPIFMQGFCLTFSYERL